MHENTKSAAMLVDVKSLSLSIDLGTRKVYALDDITFAVRRGETVGIVGESGSGKSVLVRAIMGLFSGSKQVEISGYVGFDGKDMLVLERRQLRQMWGDAIGIVLQDPLASLHPIKRIGKQLTEAMRRHDRTLSAKDAEARAENLLRVVGIPEAKTRLRAYPHQLSGGMRQRVMIAIAISNSPDLIIADEPTTALDVTVQAQVLALLTEVREREHAAMLLITHDLGVVATRTDRIIVMYAGQIVESAATVDLFDQPLMPYTRDLLLAIPRIEAGTGVALGAIPGNPPDLSTPHTNSCRYADRCSRVEEKCREEAPPLEFRGDHGYRCWFPLDTVITRPDYERAQA